MSRSSDTILMHSADLKKAMDKHAVDAYLKEKQQDLRDDNPEEFTFRHLIKTLREEVNNLPAHEARVVRLKFWENLSEEEIAEELNLTLKEVQKNLKKALEKLKKNIMYRLLDKNRFNKRDVLCFIDR